MRMATARCGVKDDFIFLVGEIYGMHVGWWE